MEIVNMYRLVFGEVEEGGKWGSWINWIWG